MALVRMRNVAGDSVHCGRVIREHVRVRWPSDLADQSGFVVCLLRPSLACDILSLFLCNLLF